MSNVMSDSFSKANGAVPEFKNVANQLEKMSHDTGKKMGAMASDIADSTSRYIKTGREYVQENPAKGVVLAVAAGVVAGGLITLAMRSNNR